MFIDKIKYMPKGYVTKQQIIFQNGKSNPCVEKLLMFHFAVRGVCKTKASDLKLCELIDMSQ